MKISVEYFNPVLTLLFVSALTLYGCSGRETVTEKNFVGKWQSSKINAPVYLYANEEWEINLGDGHVMQYGIWQYQDNKIIWSFKESNSRIVQDVNPVLSVSPQEFQIQERDGAITTFKKLDGI